jgi:hypothetical protein
MSNLQLVFSPRAKERLLQIAEYLSGQGLENAFVIEYGKAAFYPFYCLSQKAKCIRIYPQGHRLLNIRTNYPVN